MVFGLLLLVLLLLLLLPPPLLLLLLLPPAAEAANCAAVGGAKSFRTKTADGVLCATFVFSRFTARDILSPSTRRDRVQGIALRPLTNVPFRLLVSMSQTQRRAASYWKLQCLLETRILPLMVMSHSLFRPMTYL